MEAVSTASAAAAVVSWRADERAGGMRLLAVGWSAGWV